MPHIGETAGKTNAIRRHEQAPATPGKWAVTGFDRYLGLLLPVVGQNLVAGLGQLGTVLLKAVQNDEVAVIHHRATVFLHVVGTGLLLLGRSAVLLLLSLTTSTYVLHLEAETSMLSLALTARATWKQRRGIPRTSVLCD